MFIIGYNAEIWIEQYTFGVLTLCTVLVAILTVFITRVVQGSWFL